MEADDRIDQPDPGKGEACAGDTTSGACRWWFLATLLPALITDVTSRVAPDLNTPHRKHRLRLKAQCIVSGWRACPRQHRRDCIVIAYSYG